MERFIIVSNGETDFCLDAEVDGQMWLDDVFIPWEHVFLLGESPEPAVRWLIWHHLYGWRKRLAVMAVSVMQMDDV